MGEDGTVALIRGVAKDRRISIEDADMRHGRTSRSVLFDGDKRHVLTDLDAHLVLAAGITAAHVAEAAVTDAIAAGLAGLGVQLAGPHLGRAYLSCPLVRDRTDQLRIFCKAWRVRGRGDRFAETAVSLDFTAGQLTGPAGGSCPSPPGGRRCGCPRAPGGSARCANGAPPARPAAA